MALPDRVPLQFAGCGSHQRVDDQEFSRDLVTRQRRAAVCTQLLRGRWSLRVLWHELGDGDLSEMRMLLWKHAALAHAGVRLDDGLDFLAEELL